LIAADATRQGAATSPQPVTVTQAVRTAAMRAERIPRAEEWVAGIGIEIPGSLRLPVRQTV